MAKSAKNEESTEPQVPQAYDKPPDLSDFQDVTAARADGWFQPEPGAWLMGRLLGRYEMNQLDANGKKRAFYQIRVTQCSAKMIAGKGDDAKEVPIAKGHIVAFDERKSLEVLRPYADSDGVYDTFVQSVSKEPIKGTNRTFWRFETKTKTLRPPKTPRASLPTDDDIPF